MRLSYGRRSVDVEYIPIVLLHINSGVKGKIQNFLRFCVLSLTLISDLCALASASSAALWPLRTALAGPVILIGIHPTGRGEALPTGRKSLTGAP